MILDLFVIAFFFSAGAPAVVLSSTLNEANQTSNFQTTPYNDPDMMAAATKARAGIDSFLKKLKDPPQGTNSYAVKIGVADRDGGDFAIVNDNPDEYLEYLWVSNISATATGFVGTIDNDPEIV